MQQCQQTETQSVYSHGQSVKEHIFQIINYLESGEITEFWRLPDWISQYREPILKSLLSKEIIEEYAIYHDCGKPYCLTVDVDGKRHFPNHAEVSYQTWLNIGGNPQAAKCMKLDMFIHTMKAVDVDEFCKHPEAITLLLTGLAEVHSNAKMFGGIDSTSFKIKWNQINKRGKKIVEMLYNK